MEDFGDATFDAAVDKGTLDAILCGENSTANAQKMLSELYRVLVPTGADWCLCGDFLRAAASPLPLLGQAGV